MAATKFNWPQEQPCNESRITSVYLARINQALDKFGKRESLTRFKPQNSMLHGAR